MDTTMIANLISAVLPTVTPYLDKHPREVLFVAVALWLIEQAMPLFKFRANSLTQALFFGLSKLLKLLIRKGNQQ